jgi:hypothetical protein
MALLNEADEIYVGSALAAKAYLGSTQVWPPTPSVPAGHAVYIGGINEVVILTDASGKTFVAPGTPITEADDS